MSRSRQPVRSDPPADPSAEAARAQGRQWGRHAARYDDVFLDPFRPGVENPIPAALKAIPDPKSKSVIDLGCGTGPLLPLLVKRFGEVVALDFAPAMIRRAKERFGPSAAKVRFLARPMDDLDDLAGRFDAAVAMNSLVMPDVRLIDRTLVAIRACLKPDGRFLGVVPSIDALHYHTMLLIDREIDAGKPPEEAERLAAFHGEHHFYDFAFGKFLFRGLKQKFWQPFEIEHRLARAGFREIALDKVLYPWDEHVPGGDAFAEAPRSWDWAFSASP